MTGAEILVRIRTFFERKGADDATASMRQTAQAAKQTGQQAAQAGEQGAGGMNVMSAATAALNGNFAGTASAIVPLITKIQALKTAITSISLVAAGLTVLYTAFTKISEYAAKAAETVAEFNLKSRQDMIDAVTKAYNLQAAALERIGKIRDAELERQKAENDANKEFELATSRQEKLKELQGTTDETKRAQIESKYARVEQQITGKYDSQNDEAEFARMKKREDELRKAAENNARDLSQKQALLRRAQNQAGEAESKTESLKELKPTSLISWAMSSQMIKVKEAEATKARAQEEKLVIQIDKLENERNEITDEINKNVGLRPSVQKRMQASRIGRDNSTASLDLADSDRKGAEQEAMYTEYERLQTIATRLHPVDVATITADLERASKSLELSAPYIKRIADAAERNIKAFEDQEARQRNIQ